MHIMLDLETYGNTPGSMILSIGAQAFDETRLLGDGLYCVVHKGGRYYGLHRDQSTVDWWSRQGDEARSVVDAAKRAATSKPLPDALDDLDEYVRAHEPADCLVWGCGSDFDNALIRAAYRAVSEHREPAWQFWNNRCYRTLKSFAPDIRIDRAKGVHHNALDDARAQAEHAIKLFRHVNRP